MTFNKLAVVLLALATGATHQAFGQNVSNTTQVGNSNAKAGATNTTSVNAGSNSAAYGGSSHATARGGAATASSGGSANASNGGSATSSTGASRSVSGVTLNLYGGAGSTGSGTDAGGTTAGTGSTGTTGGGDPTINYSGGYTVHNTPDAPAPAMYGGTNPCSVGVSAGVAVAGFGMSGGSTWSDHGCERRNGAVILFQASMPDVAVALLCEDPDMRTAFTVAGKPCPQDRRPVAVSSAAPPAPTPAQTAAVEIKPQPVAGRPTDTPATKLAMATSTPSRGPAGYQGPKPEFCNQPVKDTTDRAYQAYYCR